MKWSGTHVLVTGAGGFIGSHLAGRLCGVGAQVRAFVRYNSRGDEGLLRYVDPNLRREIEIVMGDLKDPETVRKAVRGMDVVFHLGAVVAIPYSYHSPLDFVQTNVVGTAYVLAAALDAGVRRVVHTSTSEVYGTAQHVPIDERHPLQGQSPYSASKIGADKLAESYFRSFDLPVVTVRPFNAYGPRQSARAIIPAIIAQALAGGVIRLGLLHPTRDFTYVDDTVDGFLRAGEVEGIEGHVFNIGSGCEISVADLVKMIGQVLHVALRVEVEPQRVRPAASEVERLVADASLARQVLGWQPGVPIEQGLASTIDWLGEHLELYRPGVYAI
jgi:dTDP-glucose 4,6-dehydratase